MRNRFFVRGIHEHETCHTVGALGREDADVETPAGGRDEDDRSGDAAAVRRARRARSRCGGLSGVTGMNSCSRAAGSSPRSAPVQ